MALIRGNDPSGKFPNVLAGFENIQRYWEKKFNRPTAKILPGEYYVTINDELITTVLGSCVSACIRDRVFGVGGMNHFMLPSSADEGLLSEATRYGNYAMEHMINDILKNGGKRENLEVKLVGGGQIIKNMSDVGARNISFVRQYIVSEGLKLVGEDLGDIHPRKVLYHPPSGKVRVKKLRSLHNTTIVEREENYKKSIQKEPVTGEIELF